MSIGAMYLLERLRDTRESATTEDRWADEDVEDLGLEVAEYLCTALDVPALERELVARAQIDVDSILWLVNSLGAIAESSPQAFKLDVAADESNPIDWQARIQRLREATEGLQAPQQLGTLEVVLRLSLLADAAVDTLLAALPPDHRLKSDLRLRLREKLDLLTDDKAMAFWSQLRFQVDPARDVRFDIDAASVDRDFFDLGNAIQVRDRIAKYLAVVRPVLEKSLVEKGNTLVPTGTTGIASVLSWTRTPSTTEWSPREQSVVRSLGRVAALWSSSRDELARSLGIEVDGYFLGGRGEREAKTPLPRDAKSKPKQLRLLDELTKLVRIAEQRRFYVEGSVERTLRCFKLGAEVAAEDVIPTWRKRKELYFQRQLIKFFVERGLTAFGTKFGRSEIDMRAHDSFGALVVETKILKGALSVRSLNRWLTQLGSYMDIEHVALRGALVIFNFGNSPIFAPATAIRFRYFVVVINLCAESPSKRSASIEIEEARDATDVVRLVPLGSDPPERVRRRPAARSRKTK